MLTMVAEASAKPPVTAFSDEPAMRGADLSPDGSKVIFISRIKGEDVLSLYDLPTRKSSYVARLGAIHVRSLRFINDKYVVLVVSKKVRDFYVRGSWENSTAFSYNLSTGTLVQLLKGSDHLWPQSGLGQIVGVDPDGQHVYMPAFMGDSAGPPSRDLVRVDLENGKAGSGSTEGVTQTVNWVMDASGKPAAREDYDPETRMHTVFAYNGAKSQKIYSKQEEQPETSIAGISRKTGQLIVMNDAAGEFTTIYEMSRTDGAASPPISLQSGIDIDGLVVDRDHAVFGVRYSGLRPSYQMFDKDIDADVKQAAASLPNSSLFIDSWSADWSKILFHVSGGAAPERFVVMDRQAKKLAVIMNMRPDIKSEEIGEINTIEYKARDGLTIPAIVTWPAGVSKDQRKSLPLVVLPHGGPEAYDQVQFDWLAQFIASEGYLVLQPNFRGSAGFGATFMGAGHKQWGRKMQDDITDGVQAITAMGWADPSKVCIVGWSYGGYAALAGGELTPNIYRCVAAIAGVSDLNQMLAFERNNHGPKSRVYAYWKDVIGDPDKDKAEIDAVSPARHPDAFTAPVLLVHGSEDTVVPSSQSDRMEDALKAKGKTVTYLKIKGDDHGLIENDSRTRALTALSEFLARYLN